MCLRLFSIRKRMKGYHTENLDGSLFVNLVLGKWILFYYAFKSWKCAMRYMLKSSQLLVFKRKNIASFILPTYYKIPFIFSLKTFLSITEGFSNFYVHKPYFQFRFITISIIQFRFFSKFMAIIQFCNQYPTPNIKRIQEECSQE